MDRFVSHHVLRLDAKGRVSVPASFRAVLARDGFDGLYCYPAFDRPALDAGGNALLAEIETLIAGIFAVLRAARAILARALWLKRNSEDRRRRPRRALRCSQEPCRDHRGRRVCWSRPQISHLGARPISRGTDGGHRQGSRVQAAIGSRDGGTKTAWSTGMMTGSDSNAVAGGLARHVPVLARRAVEWLGVREGGVYVDATFGAGGYSRADPGDARCAGDRHRPRSKRRRTRRDARQRGRRPAGSDRGSLFQPRSGRRKLRRRCRRRRGVRPRRLLHAA